MNTKRSHRQQQLDRQKAARQAKQHQELLVLIAKAKAQLDAK